MKVFKPGVLAVVLLSVLSWEARSQIVMTDTDSPSVKWNSVTMKDYKVIYPRGLDSLGLIYGQKLQYYNMRVGLSAGMFPNESWKKPLQVILHAYNAEPNGMVAVTPRRMELFTLMEPTASLTPLPWETLLAIHENRHVAQAEFKRKGPWKYTYWPFGELSTLGISFVYGTKALMEGDAVVTETALTRAGRGRSADFLGYYRMCFDQGDIRNWYRWGLGSMKLYTPDVYRLGYITIAGIRTRFGAPMYMADYLDRLQNAVAGLSAMPQSVRHATGKKFLDAWPDLAEHFHRMWEENDSLRAPFTEYVPLVEKRKYYTSYTSLAALGDVIYAVKAGLDYNPRLVRIEKDGEETSLCFFGGDMLEASEKNNALYWQETIPNPIWPLKQDSRIVRYDLETEKRAFLTKGSRYFNPSVSPDGKVISVTELPVEGGSRIVLLDAETGEKLGSWASPAGHQVLETVLYDDCVYFNSLSDDGIRLCRASLSGTRIDNIEECLPAAMASFRNLNRAPEGGVVFISDRTGQSDAYLYDGASLKQLSSTKYGISWPVYLGNTLYASAMTPDGRLISKILTEERPAVFDEVWANPIADRLSAQEKALQANAILQKMDEMPAPAPAKYSKLGHAVKVHSWLPVYFNISGFNASYYDRYTSASPGAMLFFQNDLGNFGGSVGVSAHSQVFEGSKIAPVGGHLWLRYNGIWPNIMANFDIGDRAAATMTPYHETTKDTLFVKYTPSDKAYMGGGITASFPFDLSSGAWTRSLEASVSFSASNDKLYSPYIDINQSTNTETPPTYSILSDCSSFTVNLSGSAKMDEMPAQLAPTRGGGFSLSFKEELFYESYYGTVYGYFPGLTSAQALLITATGSINNAFCYSLWPSSDEVSVPRGLEKVTGLKGALSFNTRIAMLSADYSIPFLRVDWTMGNFGYLRNCEIVPFVDFSALKFTGGSTTYSLFSAGADLAVHTERLFWLSLPLRIGVRLSYNGGSGMALLKNDIDGLNNFSCSLIFQPSL